MLVAPPLSVQLVVVSPAGVMMIGPLMSAKFVVYPPLPSPELACKALVRTPAVFQVITMSLPCGASLITRNTEAGLVGSRPNKNWLVLLIPLPSGSAFGAAIALVVLPKYCTCHAWKLPGGGAVAVTVITTVTMFTEVRYPSFT